MIGTIQIFLMRACLCALAVSLLALAWLKCRNGLLAAAGRVTAAWRGLSVCGRVVCLTLALALTIYGGTKTNSLPQLLIRPLRVLFQPVVSDAQKMISNWNVRGAWDDSFRLEFEEGWELPWGDGHLHGVEIHSQGVIHPDWADTNAVAGVGAPIAIVPGTTTFSAEKTARDSYLVQWIDAARNRDTNDLVTASIELCRNGNRIVTVDGVETNIVRELPFAHDGFGQDAEWVAANFTNATEIAAAGGYVAWVDTQVGEGLTNGLYKLTVGVLDDPPETVNLVVGDTSVAVTNAGEYVFLLEKGVEYSLDASADCATNFVYSAIDDVPATPRLNAPPRSAPATEYGVWSRDVGRAVVIRPPGGLIFFTPKLSVAPERWQPSWLEPSRTFSACLTDVRPYRPATYRWRSDGAAVGIANATAQEATVSCAFPYDDDSMIELSLEATIAGRTLDVHYRCPVARYGSGDWTEGWEGGGTNLPPVGVSVAVTPDMVFFGAGSTNGLIADVACNYRIENAGTLTLNIFNGDNCIVKDASGNVVMDGYTWPVGEQTQGARFFMVTGTGKSSAATGTVFSVTYTPEAGTDLTSNAANVTFVEVTPVADANWPADKFRKTLGVCETAKITMVPKVPGVGLVSSLAGALSDGGLGATYEAPDFAATDLVSTTRGEALFAFTVVEPTGYRVNFTTISNGTQVVGEAGDFSVVYDLTLLPDAVSFSNIELKEVGVLTTNATGYFSEPAHSNLLHHTDHYGADVWNEVGAISNSVVDTATVVELLPPWQDGGEMTWPIPNVYRKAGTTNVGCWFCNTDQGVLLTPEGTVELEKFDRITQCTTNRISQQWVIEP